MIRWYRSPLNNIRQDVTEQAAAFTSSGVCHMNASYLLPWQSRIIAVVQWLSSRPRGRERNPGSSSRYYSSEGCSIPHTVQVVFCGCPPWWIGWIIDCMHAYVCAGAILAKGTQCAVTWLGLGAFNTPWRPETLRVRGKELPHRVSKVL